MSPLAYPDLALSCPGLFVPDLLTNSTIYGSFLKPTKVPPNSTDILDTQFATFGWFKNLNTIFWFSNPSPASSPYTWEHIPPIPKTVLNTGFPKWWTSMVKSAKPGKRCPFQNCNCLEDRSSSNHNFKHQVEVLHHSLLSWFVNPSNYNVYIYIYIDICMYIYILCIYIYVCIYIIERYINDTSSINPTVHLLN